MRIEIPKKVKLAKSTQFSGSLSSQETQDVQHDAMQVCAWREGSEQING
jgi:hypothetical protein